MFLLHSFPHISRFLFLIFYSIYSSNKKDIKYTSLTLFLAALFAASKATVFWKSLRAASQSLRAKLASPLRNQALALSLFSSIICTRTNCDQASIQGGGGEWEWQLSSDSSASMDKKRFRANAGKKVKKDEK